MKCNYNGMELEGDAKELSEFINGLRNESKEEVQLIVSPKKVKRNDKVRKKTRNVTRVKKWTTAEDKQLMNLVNSGASYRRRKEFAKKVGRTVGAVNARAWIIQNKK